MKLDLDSPTSPRYDDTAAVDTIVTGGGPSAPPPRGYLVMPDWNEWLSYSTIKIAKVVLIPAPSVPVLKK
jgi:hypothetical protein